MAMSSMGVTLIMSILVVLGTVAAAAGEPSPEDLRPALKYWEKKLPGVAVPVPLREAVSPIEESALADLFASHIQHGTFYPSTSAFFCEMAGLACDDESLLSLRHSQAGNGDDDGVKGDNTNDPPFWYLSSQPQEVKSSNTKLPPPYWYLSSQPQEVKGSDTKLPPPYWYLSSQPHEVKGSNTKLIPAYWYLSSQPHEVKGSNTKLPPPYWYLSSQPHEVKGSDTKLPPPYWYLSSQPHEVKGSNTKLIPAYWYLSSQPHEVKGSNTNPATWYLSSQPHEVKGDNTNPATWYLSSQPHEVKGDNTEPARYKGDKSSTDELDTPSKGYFVETDIVEGATTRVKEQPPIRTKPFMPKVVADALPPLSRESLSKLQRIFNINEGTDMFRNLRYATSVCDNSTALEGEDVTCPVSLKSLAEFLATHVGPDAKLLTNSPRPRTVMGPMKITNFTLHHSPEDKLSVVTCHPLHFPSQLYMCHALPHTKVVEAILTDAHGVEFRAAGVCHLDTKEWLPEFEAFRELGTQPGTPACHWNGQEALIWISMKSVESPVIEKAVVHGRHMAMGHRKLGHNLKLGM